MSESGSCLCGNIKISYKGKPDGASLCHCQDCKKITGATYSTNFIIPDDQFTLVAGNPKKYTKTADSGKSVTSFFCGDCGSTLWRETPSFPGTKILKAGVLEGDSLDNATWGAELFAGSRQKWVPQQQGATQVASMPS